jgi:hypothetical protein
MDLCGSHSDTSAAPELCFRLPAQSKQKHNFCKRAYIPKGKSAEEEEAT